jgi:signal transduction histidine kinase
VTKLRRCAASATGSIETGDRKERRELFANVSHELRTPIATLRGYLENNLKDHTENAQTPPSTIWQDLEIMEHEVLQLQERTDELFLLSKTEVGQEAIQSAPCEIRHIVHAIASSYAPLAWNAGKIELVADIPHDVPLVLADAQRLEQALGNLLRNALRHTPPGGIIALVIEVEPQQVALSVEDTGEGIAPEELEHIWERFYQSNKSRGGAGIGLTLVKDWIEAMGGSVAVESTLGEGSRFTLYLLRS